jgi:hypothetical protein
LCSPILDEWEATVELYELRPAEERLWRSAVHDADGKMPRADANAAASSRIQEKSAFQLDWECEEAANF